LTATVAQARRLSLSSRFFSPSPLSASPLFVLGVGGYNSMMILHRVNFGVVSLQKTPKTSSARRKRNQSSSFSSVSFFRSFCVDDTSGS
jgi:hypothetical protein